MPNPDAPALIPRRIVFRALADTLGGQARHMARLANQPGRPGRPAPSQSRAEGRRAAAQRLRAQAATFSRWVADPSEYQGQGLDAAVAGYLVALAYGHQAAFGELAAELAELGRPGVLDGFRADDLVGIVGKIIDETEA